MKKTAVIVAGGSGRRMGTELPKQFLMVHQKPVLYYTIEKFMQAYDDMQVVLVLPEAYVDLGQEIIDAWFDTDRVKIVVGGTSRFESVKNGLAHIQEECIIFVHDAVRCLLSTALIQRCYEAATDTGSAVPVVPASDSLRLLTEDGNEALDRNKIMLVQTPQTFHSKILLPAFEIDYKEKFTDEASVVEAFGLKISLIKGEPYNIKITHPVDLHIAAAVLEQKG